MLRRTVIALTCVAVVTVVAWPRQARAELPAIAGSVYGGEVDNTSRGALSIGTGWPSFFVQYNFHTSGNFGIGLRSDLYYGNPTHGFGFGPGWGFSVPMRIQVMDRNDWSLSIPIDAGIWMGFGNYYNAWYRDGWFVFGPRIGSGIIASVQPVDALNVFFGMRLYFNILVISPDYGNAWADLVVQILPFAGVELSVHRMIALFFQLHAGPSVGAEDQCRDWDRNQCVDWRHNVWVQANFQFYFGATFHFGN